MEAERFGSTHPVGLAFSTRSNQFYTIEGGNPDLSDPSSVDLLKVSASASQEGRVNLPVGGVDPLNVTYDAKFNRLLLFRTGADELLLVREDHLSNLDTKNLTVYDARTYGILSPQGMTVDPATGDLFILDAVGPRIIRVQPSDGGSFSEATFSGINLKIAGVKTARGIAFHPSTGHLFIINPDDLKLYELTLSGQVVAFRDLSAYPVINPQSLVFAPSGDQTDPPERMSLYVSDSGSGSWQQLDSDTPSQGETDQQIQSSGQILEFSLVQPPAAPQAAQSLDLIRAIEMAAVSPPSPDPSGIAYVSGRNTLLISDGEVEETVEGITHFAGANLWEMTLSGSVVRTANISKVPPTVVGMSNEPTGTAWNQTNGHYYFTDDIARLVFDLNPGPDGLVGTADDSWTSFSTKETTNWDLEGITYDKFSNTLFIADGVDREIYQYSTEGVLLSQFDVEKHGIVDPETVEFNPFTGTLFVLSSTDNSLLIEVTTAGKFLNAFDISASGARSPAGLAYAPASGGSGKMSFYIVDRRVDNNTNPELIDGMLYEISAPLPDLKFKIHLPQIVR